MLFSLLRYMWIARNAFPRCCLGCTKMLYTYSLCNSNLLIDNIRKGSHECISCLIGLLYKVIGKASFNNLYAFMCFCMHTFTHNIIAFAETLQLLL